MTLIAIRAFLASVPGWVWGLVLLAAVLIGTYWLGKSHERAACEDRWEAAQEATEAENSRREAAAFKAGTEAAQKAAQAQADTRKQTDEAVEVVKIEWRDRIVRLPAECRVEQSDRMRDEGRKAVRAARDSL